MGLSGSLLELTPDRPAQGAGRHARNRALAAWACVCVGVWLGLELAPFGVHSTLYFGAAAATGALAMLLKRPVPNAALLATAAVLAGAGLVTARSIERPAQAVSNFLPGVDSDATLIEVDGMLLTDPEPTPEWWAEPGRPVFRGDTWNTTLAVQSVRTGEGDLLPTSGTLLLRIGGQPPHGAGERVRITGRFRPPAPAMNPGERDNRNWWAQRGVVGTLSTPDADLIEPLPGGGIRSQLIRARETLRQRCRRAIGAGDDNSPGASVLAAVTLGERGPGFDATARTYRELGVSHLLAISGFHLVVMAGALLAAIRLTGDRGWVEPAIVAVVVALYLSVSPIRPAVLRAGIVVLAVLLSEASGRRHDRAGLIAWTGVALLIWRPMDLFDLGYQLTFLLTLALATLAARFDARLWRRTALDEPAHGPVRSAVHSTQRLISAGLVCWLVATPILAHHTGAVGPMGWLVTLLLLPIFVPMVWIGFATMLLGAAVPPLAEVLRPAGEALGGASVWAGELAARVPGATWTAPPISAWLACAGVLLAVLVLSKPIGLRTIAVMCVVAVWFGAEWRLRGATDSDVLLRIDTLAVGDGSCHLIRSGSDAILWDCGSMRSRIGARTVPSAVRALGRRAVSTAVVTHANADHYNGLPLAHGPIGVERVLAGPGVLARVRSRPYGPTARTVEWLERAGVRIETISRGDTFRFGSARVAVLSPPLDDGFVDENDRSLVGLIEVDTDAGPRRLLMTGDIQAPAMRALGPMVEGLDVDILELPHHGSAHEEAYAFVHRLSPEVVLQSTGPSRLGDARWNGVRAEVDAWLVTSRDGALWAEVRRDGSVRSGTFR